jgi:short-subunit dehydrogenase
MKSNSYALITGSSSGIGKAIAYEFARLKVNVILVALPGSGTEDVRRDLITNFGVKADLLETNLTEPGSPNAIFSWCISRQYDVEILVNNAGFGNLCCFEETAPELITRMLSLNNHVLVALTQLFIPHLKRRGGGYVLNVGSLAAFFPLPNKSVYAATKSFVYAFSAALRVELKPYHIHVCCLCPGGTITNASIMDRLASTRIGNWNFHQMPDAVAKEAVQKLFQRKKRIIPGLINKMFYQLSLRLPSYIVEWIVQQIFSHGAKVKINNPQYNLRPVQTTMHFGKQL